MDTVRSWVCVAVACFAQLGPSHAMNPYILPAPDREEAGCGAQSLAKVPV